MIDISTVKLQDGEDLAYHYATRGWAYFVLDSLVKAKADFDSAIDIEKKPDYYFRRGEVQFSLGRYKSSIADYSVAISLCPENLEYHLSRSIAFNFIRKHHREMKGYEFVLSKDSLNEDALRNLALLHSYFKKNKATALSFWDKLIEFYPEPENYFLRGDYFMEKSFLKSASRDFETALNLDPENISYLTKLAYSYGMLGRLEEALKFFDRALEIDKHSGMVFKFRGMVYMKNGFLLPACEDLKKAEEMNLSVKKLLKKCKCRNF